MIIIPFFLYEIDRRQVYSIFLAFIRKLLVITDTELKAIAAAAIIGFSKKLQQGYNTPAAKGIPIRL